MTIIAAPAEIDFACLQGSPFQAVLKFFQDEAQTMPVDFTGYTFEMQLREGVADSDAPVVFSLASVASTAAEARIVFVGANTDGSPNIDGTPDPTNGMIYLHLTSAETSTIHATKPPKLRTFPAVSNFFYDLEATPPGGEPRRIAYGAFDLSLEVTRS